MKKLIAIKPRYTPLTQQRMCCVPCAVQWVLLRRKLPIFTQEEIGSALELTVPGKFIHLFGPRIRTAKKKPPLGWGSKGNKNATAYNKFFKKNKIPLQGTYYPHSKLEKPAELIATNLKKGNDVMFITYMTPINKSRRWGHALIATAIKLSKNPTVTVGDPDWRSPKFYDVELAKILKGMTKEVGGHERGLYIFSGRAH